MQKYGKSRKNKGLRKGIQKEQSTKEVAVTPAPNNALPGSGDWVIIWLRPLKMGPEDPGDNASGPWPHWANC